MLSPVIGLAGPPIVFGLWSLFNQVWTEVPEAANAFAVVTIFILCPLATAFFGHAARRQIRKEIQNKSRGYMLAGVGLGLGYFEMAFAILISFDGVHHPPRIAMYEAAAVGSMRTINLAARSYAGTRPQERFPRTLKDMARESDKDWSIGEALADGVKSKYRFMYAAKARRKSERWTHIRFLPTRWIQQTKA